MRLFVNRPLATMANGKSASFNWMVALLCLFEANAGAQSLTDFGFNSLPLPPRRPVLVILADYPIRSVAGTDTQWHRLMFAGPPAFSVANYELENSSGRFTVTPANPQPLRVQMTAADTWVSIQAANPSWNGNQVDAEALGRVVRKAIDAGFNFKAFDTNGDGTVQSPSELTLVIVNPLFNDGSAGNRSINTQQDADQTFSVAGSVISYDHTVTFDTVTHEFGHSFGIGYELYTFPPTGNAINEGMTVMATSGAGSPGASLVGTANWTPGRLHFDPWHKVRFGWSEPRIVSVAVGGRFDLPVASSGTANAPVILYNPARGTHEFFILEYRSRFQTAVNYDISFAGDQATDGEGLVIWQIATQSNQSPFWPPPLWNPGDPTLSLPLGYSSSILCRCPPDLNPFANSPWTGGQTTPYLKWFDGSSTSTRIRILPFAQGATSITVEVLAEYDAWVDFAATGTSQFGTFDYPYATLPQGIAGVGYGGNLRIKTSSGTASPITITKPMTISAYGGPVTVN